MEGFVVLAVVGLVLIGAVILAVAQTVSGETAPRRVDEEASLLRGGQLWRLSGKLTDGVTVAGHRSQVAEGKLQGREVQVELRRPFKGRQAVEYRVRVDSKLLTCLRSDGSGFPVYKQVFQRGEDEALSFKALSDSRVQRHLKTLFTRFEIDELRVADGWLVLLERDATELNSRSTQGALRLLHRAITLARAIEVVAGKPPIKTTVRIRRVDTETCPFCHDKLRGELELVSCARCDTLHHAACFTELGRCTTMGCRHTRSLPVRRRDGGVVSPLTISFVTCEACGATKRGCTAEACASSAAEQARYGRQRAYERRTLRQRQHEDGAQAPPRPDGSARRRA